MKRDIVVLGASAGGVEAISAVVKGLRRDLNACVFVVLHVAPYSPSNLPHILSAIGPLEAVHATDGAAIVQNRIYIAPPDKHLLLEAGHVVVRRGPKENHFRPSIDALFRSAAYVYGPRVIGVVLSGVLDDGTSGLWSIKRLGGIAIVQQPSDALHPEMPISAASHVVVDRTCRAEELGPLISELVTQDVQPPASIDETERRRLGLEVDIAAHDGAFGKGIMHWGDISPFTCPECHGALVQLQEGATVRFRCHTGHAFSPSTLLAGITDNVEESLWAAIRAVEEQAMILEQMAAHLRQTGDAPGAEAFLRKAKQARERARVIHESLPDHQQLSGDNAGHDD